MIEWFNRLPLGKKFATICCLFVFPIAVALYIIVSGYSQNVSTARLEQAGNAYQRPLVRLLEQIPLHRELVIKCLRGSPDARGQLAETRGRIDQAFEALHDADRRFGSTLQFTTEGLAMRKREHYRFATIRGEWEALKGRLDTLDVDQADQRHAHLVADVRVMITHAGDTSGLILDPDLDSYYLMDATLVGLPQTQERLASIKSTGEDVLGRPTMTDSERVQLVVSSALLQENDLDRIMADVQTSLTEDQNFYGVSETLQQNLPPAAKEYAESTAALLALMKKLSDPGASSASADEFSAAAAKARDASFKLWDVAVRELNRLLDKRIEYYALLRWRAVVATLLTLLLSSLAAYFVTRNITAVLHSVMHGVGQEAVGIASAASQISTSSRSLAQGASEQAASLERVSASSEEIHAMARRSTRHSSSIAELVSGTGQKFADTNRSLAEMIVAMGEIERSSGKISKIIQVIDGISFQTNILALNAAVEAARAGESGMGFAVVADEVRNLAQRCATAAHETASLIEESIAKSKDGRARVDAVAGAIREVTEETAKIKTLVDELHLGGQEQARGIEQISQAIVQMDQVAQSTASGAEQSSSAARELSAQSETLTGFVEQLTVMVSGAR